MLRPIGTQGPVAGRLFAPQQTHKSPIVLENRHPEGKGLRWRPTPGGEHKNKQDPEMIPKLDYFGIVYFSDSFSRSPNCSRG